MEIDKPTGEFVKLQSEIDKYVKNVVVDSAIKLMRKRKKVLFTSAQTFG
ncbi:MAG: hypothetical protein P4M11_00230 [Candidatus Pacebacteria bacterium]|nr:hypothetical protein [Candidatus Paceibacterota bacterium]